MRLAAFERVVTEAMAGEWEGRAHIIVNWVQQTNLVIRLHVQRDGAVSGIIGDAVLTKGRLRSNRGWLGRKLNIKTDYMIEGRLNGPLLGAENISRASVKMPLNFNGTNFVGGLHTSGCKLGRKRSGVLSARVSVDKRA
jgi:hypothetical protein